MRRRRRTWRRTTAMTLLTGVMMPAELPARTGVLVVTAALARSLRCLVRGDRTEGSDNHDVEDRQPEPHQHQRERPAAQARTASVGAARQCIKGCGVVGLCHRLLRSGVAWPPGRRRQSVYDQGRRTANGTKKPPARSRPFGAVRAGGLNCYHSLPLEARGRGGDVVALAPVPLGSV